MLGGSEAGWQGPKGFSGGGGGAALSGGGVHMHRPQGRLPPVEHAHRGKDDPQGASLGTDAQRVVWATGLRGLGPVLIARQGFTNKNSMEDLDCRCLSILSSALVARDTTDGDLPPSL